MPRPCLEDHPLSPLSCRVCRWCSDDSDLGAFHRQQWGEPEPNGELATAYPSREIVPGLLDPIPEPELRPVPDCWPSDPRVIRRHREALLRLARSEMPSPGRREGAGVLLVGGGRYWPGIVVAVKMLRDTGCKLPVQIWHRGNEEPVRPSDLAGMGAVEVHDLTRVRPAPRALNGWEAKTLALLASGWERIFFLDADAYFVSDPTPLFERLSPAEPFLYWEDHPSALGKVKWPIWGLERSAVPPIQGGEFAIHIRHFWRDLVLAHWIDQHSDFSYAHQYGDQDSWRVALTISGGPFKCLEESRWDEIAHICDYNGKPLVVHRCWAKMFFPEDVTPSSIGWTNRRLNRLPEEARAWAHFDALLSARPAAEAFGQVYASGIWGPNQCSGDGSAPEQAQPYLDLVNGLLKLSGVRKVIDLACGDGYIASRLEAPEVVGVECHAPHVDRLRRESPGKQWLHLDLDRDRDKLPSGDVALLKDVLHHWPNRLVRDWLAWARTCGKWRWLICTQDRNQVNDGDDCPLGGYRALSNSLEPLRSMGFAPLSEYLYKSVLVFSITSR